MHLPTTIALITLATGLVSAAMLPVPHSQPRKGNSTQDADVSAETFTIAPTNPGAKSDKRQLDDIPEGCEFQSVPPYSLVCVGSREER